MPHIDCPSLPKGSGLTAHRLGEWQALSIPRRIRLGNYSFGYVGETDGAVIVSRENGKDTRIPIAKLETGVSAVRQDPQIYDEGPSWLRDYGITHINSPVWSLLHLVTKSEILG